MRVSSPAGARSGTARRALLALLVPVAVLLLLEALLALAGRCPPDAPTPLRLPGGVDLGAFSRPDPVLLYALVPETGVFPWYDIDRHGWRTPDVPDAAAPGTFRLAVTGDSCTFGLGLAEEQTWPARLRRALSALCEGDASGRRVEVLNTAITGYSTLQDRLSVQRDVLPLRPDLVLLMLTGVNDAHRLDGPGDVALFASQGAWWRGLFRTRTACLLGLSGPGFVPFPPEPQTPGGGRPRLSPEEVEAELDAFAELLPGRFALGWFPPSEAHAEVVACRERIVRAAEHARAAGWPVVDTAPELLAVAGLPVYADDVHPTHQGTVPLARAALGAVLDRVGLSEARTAWARAWLSAPRGGLLAAREVLEGPGAPPRFRTLLDALRAPDVDARLSAGDPSLPETLRRFDPLLGRAATHRSLARALLQGAPESRLAEMRDALRPADPLIACFGGETAFLAAGADARTLGRAVLAYAAELGLPSPRADVRVSAARAADLATLAESRLRAALALDPSDAEARLDLVLLLRETGRAEDERAQLEALAGAEGPLAAWARGTLAARAGDDATAESALREAVAGAPSLGWAHETLGEVLLRAGRLDEATASFAFAAMLTGRLDALGEQLAAVDAARGAPIGGTVGVPGGVPGGVSGGEEAAK